MKFRRLLLFVLIIIIVMYAYVGISTKFINETSYRKLGWEASKHSKAIVNWENADVKLVNLHDNDVKHLFYPYQSIGGKISRHLLILNGNYAVYVQFPTISSVLVGPVGLYFNPFTKTLIGFDARD